MRFWPLCVLVLSAGSLDAEPQPQWPAEFSANFTSPATAKDTSGFWASSSEHRSEVLRFQDGTRDHLCSAYHNGTACTVLATGGWRYLIWPALNRCCRCCSDATGCGALRPDWLANLTGNIHYEGIVTVRAADDPARRCHKWAVIGLSARDPNYWLQAADGSGRPCEFDGYNYLRTPAERADDDYVLTLSTYVPRAPPSLFKPPPECDAAAMCGSPVCDT